MLSSACISSNGEGQSWSERGTCGARRNATKQGASGPPQRPALCLCACSREQRVQLPSSTQDSSYCSLSALDRNGEH
jgi:hypothetical protein